MKIDRFRAFAPVCGRIKPSAVGADDQTPAAANSLKYTLWLWSIFAIQHVAVAELNVTRGMHYSLRFHYFLYVASKNLIH
jgi:hypothetical protein